MITYRRSPADLLMFEGGSPSHDTRSRADPLTLLRIKEHVNTVLRKVDKEVDNGSSGQVHFEMITQESLQI